MAMRNWTLTDRDQDIYVDHIALDAQQLGGKARGYKVAKRRLETGLSQGVDVIEVDNGAFRFVVVPTRGMGIWKANLGSLELGWKSPVKGPVHPSFVRLDSGGGINWLDGFDELMVRCGLESNGAPEWDAQGRLQWPLHGKIANIPAHTVRVGIDGDSGDIAVTGIVDETRLFGNKLRLTSIVSTRVGQPGFTVSDTVTNLSAQTSELQLLYHTNFGMPLVGPGARVVLPVRKMAPRDATAAVELPAWDRYGPETPGQPESCFFFDLAADTEGQTKALLCNAAGDQGVSMRFNKRQFPCFTLWKNCLAAADGYVTGLEPATNFPNPRSAEKRMGRVVTLAAGESRSFEITVTALGDAAAVEAAEAAVLRLQEGTTPEVLAQPNPDWSPQ